MSKRIGFGMVFLMVLAMTAATFAQPPGGGQRGQRGGPGGPGNPGGGPGGGMGGGIGFLMGSDEAKAHIGVTEDQAKQLEQASQEMRDAMRALFQQGQGQQQRPDPAAFQKLNADMMAKVEKILPAEQLQKAKVLAFQTTGGLDGIQAAGGTGAFRAPSAIGNEFAMGALKLTPEQLKTLQELQAKTRDARMALLPQGRGQGSMPPPEEMEKIRAKMEEITAGEKAEVLKVLTDEQKALAKKLVDETPAFVDQIRQQRRGPGGPGGGNDPNAPGYRPGSGSWQPGQGGNSGNRPRRQGGGGFPSGNE